MVLGSLRSLGTIIKDLVKGWFSFDGEGITLSGVVSAIWKAITTAFTNIGKFIASFWEGAFNIELPSLDELGTKIWNTIKQTFDNLKKMVTDFFKNMFKDFKLPSVSELLGGAGDLAKGAAGAVGGLVSGGIDLAKGAAGKAGDFIGGLLGDAKDGAAKVGEKLGPMLSEGVDIAKRGLSAAGDFFSSMFSDAQPATDEAGGKIQDGMDRTAAAVRDGFNNAWNATRDFAVTQFQGAAVTIQGIFAGIVSGIETQVGTLVAGAQAMLQGGGMVPGTAVRAQAAGGRGGGTVIHQSNRVNIDARGGDPKKVQEGVQRGINPGRTARAAASGTVQK
jgi:phage-related protein